MEIYNGPYSVYIHLFPNQKVYVGITSRPVEVRWGRNGAGYFEQPLIYRAIKKYGWQNIEHEVFASKLTKQEAIRMEIKLIDLLKANDSNYGYNISTGGFGFSSITDSLLKEVDNLWREKYGVHQIANLIHKSNTVISNTLHLLGVTDEEIEQRRREQIGRFSTKYNKEEVLQYYKEGKSNKQIQEILGCSHTFVTNTLNYFNIDSKERSHRNRKRPVNQYTLDGLFIQTFRCAADAMEEISGNRKGGHIVDVCKGRRPSAYGYKWNYADDK